MSHYSHHSQLPSLRIIAFRRPNCLPWKGLQEIPATRSRNTPTQLKTDHASELRAPHLTSSHVTIITHCTNSHHNSYSIGCFQSLKSCEPPPVMSHARCVHNCRPGPHCSLIAPTELRSNCWNELSPGPRALCTAAAKLCQSDRLYNCTVQSQLQTNGTGEIFKTWTDQLKYSCCITAARQLGRRMINLMRTSNRNKFRPTVTFSAP